MKKSTSTALGLLALSLLLAPTPPAAAQPSGVILFEGTGGMGRSQVFQGDVFDLSDTRFGARRTSSVDVAPGCTATLYEFRGFRGRSVRLFERDNDLGNTPLGRSSVESLRLNCSGGGWQGGNYPGWGGGGHQGGGGGHQGGGWQGGGRGVTLYRERHGMGPSQTFDRDVPDLDRTSIGSNSASSVDVTPGCIAILYDQPWYRGRSTTFRERDNNLSNTQVGEDRVSSLQVRCDGSVPRPPGGGGGGRPPYPEPQPSRGAVVFRDRNQRGPSEAFSGDVPDLSRTSIGARTASSIWVAPGCTATLFEYPGYRGRSTTFREADNNLSNTPVGEDTASSLRVSCR